MLKIAQERSRERRRRILLAATKVFGEKGVHAATLTEICAAAGVSRSTFYDYFTDKTALLAAVPRANFEEFYAEIDAILETIAEPWDRLCAFYLGTLRYIERNPAWGRVFFLEIWPSVLASEREVRDAVDLYARRIVGILRQGIACGKRSRGGDPYLLATLVLGSMTHLVATWLLYGRPRDLSAQGAKALALLRPLVVPAAEPPPGAVPGRRAKARRR